MIQTAVNVSIVTYRTAPEELERCLSCLTSKYIRYVYVIDNGRDDAISEVCVRHGCRYIPNENVGYGAAHNIAMRRSMEGEADFHLVLNSDVYFAYSAIDSIVEYMSAYTRVGMVQPRILSPDGTLQYSVRRLPSPQDLFCRRFLPHMFFSRRDDRYLLKHLDHNKAFNVPYHQGSFMMISRNALLKSGLFDERFFMYPEDIDLTRRVHRHMLTMYYPEVEVIHCHRAESYRSMRMTWVHIVNMIKYFNKWGWWNDEERRRFNAMLDIDNSLIN